MIEINGERQPGQPYEAERFVAIGRALSKHGQNEAIVGVDATAAVQFPTLMDVSETASIPALNSSLVVYKPLALEQLISAF